MQRESGAAVSHGWKEAEMRGLRKWKLLDNFLAVLGGRKKPP